jgi:hypothetical protein
MQFEPDPCVHHSVLWHPVAQHTAITAEQDILVGEHGTDAYSFSQIFVKGVKKLRPWMQELKWGHPIA